MIGEGLAILAALSYGGAAVSIVQSKPEARADNGVFLSVLVLFGISGGIWLGSGVVPLSALWQPEGLCAIGVFALAGLSANGLARWSMYRATERIGAVPATLLRRLTPIFVLPFAYLLLEQIPDVATLWGGFVILIGVWIYLRPSTQPAAGGLSSGVMLGLLSPLAYALAYSLRGLGLNGLPDPALGTFVGAGAAIIWSLARHGLHRSPERGLRYLLMDRSPAHWRTALALSAGQLLQFFALKTSTVATVAVLGTLEVLFSAVFIWLIYGREGVDIKRLFAATLCALSGTALMMLA